MLEVDCPCVTPEVVLRASGHVEKFTDLMVRDEKTGTCYRYARYPPNVHDAWHKQDGNARQRNRSIWLVQQSLRQGEGSLARALEPWLAPATGDEAA